MPEVSLLHAVLGTAGHIDHGKSSLVRALTGTDPDRFQEEQERGMTIDIGFAEYKTADGVDVGLIDVPGHERFVRNMVAGATGMDMVMLVVAADDGVMPQTREHLEIMQVLGIERGFVVITKVDMVDEEMVELVEAELDEFLAGTFLEGAERIRCSSITGLGIDRVRAKIDALAASLPVPEVSGVFRMPVQRAFTIKGHGTVVTGVPVSGTLRVGDSLELLPKGLSARVRGIQVHHQPVEEAHAGHRAALNLSDIGWKEIHRGDVLGEPGYFTGTRLVEVRFTLLASWPGVLKDNMPVRFHIGATEALGRLVLLDQKRLEPGQSALAQVRLDETVVVAPGDRYILRLASPERTLGGGLVLGETRFRFKRFRDWVQENMVGKEESLSDRKRYLEYVVRSSGLHPVARDNLPTLLKEPAATVQADVQDLMGQGVLVALDQGRRYLHRDMVAKGAAEAVIALGGLHEADPYPFGFPLTAIASAMKHPPEVVQVFVEQARADKTVEKHGREWRSREFKGSLSNEDRRILDAVEAALKEGGLQAPIPADLAESIGKPKKRVMNILTLLEGWGRAVKVAENVHLHMETVWDARDALVAHIEEHGKAESLAMKDLFQATRKYVIPLLEHFDAQGLTKREDSVRTLLPGYEEVLKRPESLADADEEAS